MAVQINLVIIWNYMRLHYILMRWFYIPSGLLCRDMAPFCRKLLGTGDLQINDLRGWVPEE